MNKKITVESEDVRLEIELNSSKTARKILENLPFENTVSKWGKEVVIDTPLNTGPENATEDVEVGDVTYWPTGDSICIFYGPTPMSSGEKPVPASPVNPIGVLVSSTQKLEKLSEREMVTVKAADNS
ncbi:MAG: cyclophilin-like fold protein [Elusimicrobiota bacterium]